MPNRAFLGVLALADAATALRAVRLGGVFLDTETRVSRIASTARVSLLPTHSVDGVGEERVGGRVAERRVRRVRSAASQIRQQVCRRSAKEGGRRDFARNGVDLGGSRFR